ncbi:MAG: hypothetical protein QOJ65_1454 [Fimbriimonadaceae bacterium]|jgi:ATP-dependent helicase/nuclease subunit B|nr:hypothetical protein [Fimbriimonadaceae bacterium]
MAARSRLRALGLVPGAASLRLVLAEFNRGNRDVVTSLDDNLLRSIAQLMPEDDGPSPFGKVVNDFLLLCDESPKRQVGTGHYVAAIGQACEQLETDSPFAAASRFPGFHKAVARTMRELHAWSIGPSKLEAAAAKTTPETAEKLRSLALIESGARETIETLGRQLNSEQVLHALECKPAQGNKIPRVLIFTGSCDHPLVAKWIQWLADCGADVTVAMDRPTQRLFGGSEALAAMLGVPIEDRGTPNELCRCLFTDQTGHGEPKVKVTSCSDALAEAEWALRGCLQDLEDGVPPGQIAIYARNLEEYASYLEAASKRLGVRLSIARRAPIFTNRFARLVLEALEFCGSDDPRKLIPLLGCSYLGLDRKTSDEIRETARTAYKARRNAWPVMNGWAQGHEDQIPWLKRLMDWREDAIKAPLPLHMWTNRLRSLVDILPWHGSATEGPSRTRDMRAPGALQRAVANVASVRGVGEDKPVTLADFARLCRSLAEDEEYSLPANETGVSVVSSAAALGEVRSLYAIGMLEGVFPRRRSEDPILNDEDRRALSDTLELNPTLPTSFDHARQERDEFYRLCAAAGERLTLSYPQADESRDNVPAFYLHEVARALGEFVQKHNYPRVPFAPSADSCLAPADQRLRAALDSPREDPLPVYFLTKEVKDQLAWPIGQPFTPQDLRDALRCEFRHFVSKRLDLKPNREASRWSKLRNLPRATRLLHQADEASARVALEIALEAELDSMYGEAPEWEMALLRSGGRRLISEWVRREFTARQLWPKEADSLKTDIPFGAPGLRDTMPGDVPLVGAVAGTSRMGPYAVSHLYESQPPNKESLGGAPLDELDMLYYGLHLLARHGQGAGSAVEVESMSGERTLLLMPRLPEMPLPSRKLEGLDVIDLATGGEGALAQKAFYDEVKRRLKRAVQRLQQSGVAPMPGSHCSWCSYGELCRRSLDFGEEDSPFGVDENAFEVD